MTQPPTFSQVASVLRSLPDDLESAVHVRFRASGSSARWLRPDWLAIADAITRVEDRLELKRPRFDRTAIRDLRRSLEDAAEGRPRRQTQQPLAIDSEPVQRPRLIAPEAAL